MILALSSFFTANYFVSKVAYSYENIIDNSLPIMHKSSKTAELSSEIESSLIKFYFEALNNVNGEIDFSYIDKIIKKWESLESLLNELILSNTISIDEITSIKKSIQDYLFYMTQLTQQISILVEAKKMEQDYIEKIESIINYNNKILLVEMESFWKEKDNTFNQKHRLLEFEYSYQFYKNSSQLLSYFKQVILTKEIKVLNILKLNSVKLFREMENSGSSEFEYKVFADTLLYEIKPLYTGKKSIFKIRYDVLRLENVSNTLLQEQINTVKRVKKITDSISIYMQDSLAKNKNKISQDAYVVNGYLFIIIVSFIISFFSIWILVNKNLISRISNLRLKILELSSGNININIDICKDDELGDMEKSLIKLKQYVKKAKQLSITDSLTGLLNNLQFKENLKTEINRHLRQKESLSLAIIDIDYFKNYNDFYGHPKGDICLKKVSSLILKICKRAGDFAYRIGGEEFAIIMSNTTDVEQFEKLKKLQEELAKKKIEHKYSDISNILTISIGIFSAIPSENISEDIYFKKADNALYKAKKYRNSIKI
jgi:diguanylate cyclase (GGDEF)-like protein